MMKAVPLISHVQRDITVIAFPSDAPTQTTTLKVSFGPTLPDGFIVGPMGINLADETLKEKRLRQEEISRRKGIAFKENQYNPGTMTWKEARAFCHSHGGQLPIVTELQALPHPFPDWPVDSDYWTSDKDPKAGGYYFTVSMEYSRAASSDNQGIWQRFVCIH